MHDARQHRANGRSHEVVAGQIGDVRVNHGTAPIRAASGCTNPARITALSGS
jgi:hypothetical protein